MRYLKENAILYVMMSRVKSPVIGHASKYGNLLFTTIEFKTIAGFRCIVKN